MILNEIDEDLDRREMIYTLEFKQNMGDELDPEARVWCGLSEDGPFGKMMPVLFHNNNGSSQSPAEFFKGFATDRHNSNRIKPMSYTSQTKVESVKVDLKYSIQAVAKDSIKEEVHGDTRMIAQHWKENFAERSVDWEIEPLGESLSRLQMSIGVYGERFPTYMPIFHDAPTQEEIRAAVRDLVIPCVTIVSKEDEAVEDYRRFSTRIDTGIVAIE